MTELLCHQLERLGIPSADFLRRPANGYHDLVLRVDQLDLVASGSGFSESRAKRRALGEYLEGSAALTSELDLLYRTENELSAPTVDPRRLIHHDSEYYEQYSPDARLGWLVGEHTTSGRKVYVPGFDVALDYNREHTKYRQSTSFGLGAHESRDPAVDHGLRERIEADRFARFWMTGGEHPRIDPTSVSDEGVRRLVEDNEGDRGPEIGLVHLGAEYGVHTVSAYTTAESVPRLTVGLGTASELSGAIRGALLEAFVVRTTERILWNDGELTKPRADELTSFLDHAHWHALTGDGIEYLEDRPTLDVSEVECDTTPHSDRSLVDRVGDEFDVYVTDITRPVARRAGYVTVCVSVPALVEPTIDPADRPVGSPRIAEFDDSRTLHPLG